MNVERFGNFYGIWPLLDSKPLNMQWGEIRSNQAEAKAVIRNSFQELEEDVDELNAQRALLGQAFGDLVFSKKYRFFYNKVTFELCCQRNTGTVDVPIWVDAWCVRFSDGQFQAVGEGGILSAAGFYGPGLQSIEEVAESGTSADASIRNPTKIFFNADDGFGVQPISSGANTGQPEIRFTQPFGRAQAFAKAGRVWQVNHNFGIKPVLVQIMDNDDRVVIPDAADVSDLNTAWFYFNSVFSGTAYIASGGVGATSLVPRDPFYLVIRATDQPRSTHTFKPNADLRFDSRFFYVNVDMDSAHGGANKSAFVTLHSGAGGGGVSDHGALGGLLDDDHPQYLLVDGTRAMTGDLNMGGKDVLNAAAGIFKDKVVAEAFYLEPGSGGEVSKSGNDVLIRSRNGDVRIDDALVVTSGIRAGDNVTARSFYLTNSGASFTESVGGVPLLELGNVIANIVQSGTKDFHTGGLVVSSDGILTVSGDNVFISASGATNDLSIDSDRDIDLTAIRAVNIAGFVHATDSILSDNAITAEAFYLKTGGELITGLSVKESDGNPPAFNANTLVFNSENFYLDSTSAGKPQVSLRPRIYGQVGAFTKQQFAVPGALSISGGNVAWDLDNAQVATLRLTSAATLSNPSNIKTGGQYTLILTQTAAFALSFGTAYKFGDAGAPTLSTVAGERDILYFIGFGSEMFLAGLSTGF